MQAYIILDRLVGTNSNSILFMVFKPEDLLYSPEHDWVCIRGNTAYCGIAPFKLTGIHRVERICMPPVKAGDLVRKGEKILDLFYRDYRIPVYAPLTGILKEINPMLEAGQWQQIISFPIGAGWLIRIAPIGVNTRHLLQHTLYKGRFL